MHSLEVHVTCSRTRYYRPIWSYLIARCYYPSMPGRGSLKLRQSVAVVALIVSCANTCTAQSPESASAVSAPTECIPIVVDKAHDSLESESDDGPRYEIKPTECLELRAGGYNFTVPTNLRKGTKDPNAIQLVWSNELYYFDWPKGASGVKLTSASAKSPKHGAAPFRLRAGTAGLIIIGLQTLADDGRPTMNPFWIGEFLVDGK